MVSPSARYVCTVTPQLEICFARYPTARGIVCTVSTSARFGFHPILQHEIWFAWYPPARDMVCTASHSARYSLRGIPKREVWFARYSTERNVVGTVSPSSQQNLCDFATVNHNQEWVILFYIVIQILNGDNYMPLNVWQPYSTVNA